MLPLTTAGVAVTNSPLGFLTVTKAEVVFGFGAGATVPVIWMRSDPEYDGLSVLTESV